MIWMPADGVAVSEHVKAAVCQEALPDRPQREVCFGFGPLEYLLSSLNFFCVRATVLKLVLGSLKPRLPRLDQFALVTLDLAVD